MDAKLTDWATGKIVVDYDGDDEDRRNISTKATSPLAIPRSSAFFLTGGKIYAPFGVTPPT